jgi:ketosteroid isomerase-like protein
MRMTAPLICATLLLACSAHASEKDDVMARVRQIVEAADHYDLETVKAHTLDSAAFIDSIPPYLFQGTHAISDWAEAYAVFAKQNEVTASSTKLLETPTTVEITPSRAYIVVSAVHTLQMHGKPVREEGIITAVLEKIDQDWRVGSWAWTKR